MGTGKATHSSEAILPTGAIAPERWTIAILSALAATDEPMTLRDIELAVGQQLSAGGPAPVREEVELLRRYAFIEPSGRSTAVSLTPEGRALADAFAES